MYFHILFLLSIGETLNFADRDRTSQLFEYTFLESECEQRRIEVNEFIHNSSFGFLEVGGALQCLKRSGYQSASSVGQSAFRSNQTNANFLSFIQQTKEFALEMWIRVQSQGIFAREILSFHPLSTSSTEFVNAFALYQSATSVVFTIAQDLSSQQQLSTVVFETTGIVHLVINVCMSADHTVLTVIQQLITYIAIISRFTKTEHCTHRSNSLPSNTSSGVRMITLLALHHHPQTRQHGKERFIM